MELRSIAVEGDRPYVLAPLGDIQFNGSWHGIAKQHLIGHIERCQSLNAHYLGLGDYIDFMSPSNRLRQRQAALYDTAEQVLDATAEALTKQLYNEMLWETESRWLGLLSGHHFYQYTNGETTDQTLARILDAPFLGSCALVRLHFQRGSHSGSVVIWAHHGVGSGRAASPINKLEQAANHWDADIFLMGHQTKCATAAINRVHGVFSGDSARLDHKTVYLVGCGGWAKAYVEGNVVGRVPRGDYCELGMLNPAALGSPIITIEPWWRHGAWEPTITVAMAL